MRKRRARGGEGRKKKARARLKESLARLITSGSKFPVNRLYNAQAILLKEEAILLCPTFHLRLTFMSSTQFYHSDCNVSADAILPCYHLNHEGFIISSPRAGELLIHKTYNAEIFLSTAGISLRSNVLYNKWFYFHTSGRSARLHTGHWRVPNLQQSNHLCIAAWLSPIEAPWSEGKDL